MLTVNTHGKQLIFMDFYPCKAKDLTAKLAAISEKVIQITANKEVKYHEQAR